MNRPPEHHTSPQPGIRTAADQIQHSGAAPAGSGQHRRQAGGPPLADPAAEPVQTIPDHATGPPTGQHLTSGGEPSAEAAARRAGEHAQAVRSVDCECQARAGTPCGPAGDHLARYLRATQSGALTRDSLKEVIAGLDVIAPRALIQPPSQPAAGTGAATTAGQTVHTQTDGEISADRAGTPAPGLPSGQPEEPAPAAKRSCILPGYSEASPHYPRAERELEAGT